MKNKSNFWNQRENCKMKNCKIVKKWIRFLLRRGSKIGLKIEESLKKTRLFGGVPQVQKSYYSHHS